MEVEDEDDEVVAEYPLYTASIGAIYSQTSDIRLVQTQYPLRPAWRGYDFTNVKDVMYKPVHRVMNVTLPEDQPAGVCAGMRHKVVLGQARQCCKASVSVSKRLTKFSREDGDCWSSTFLTCTPSAPQHCAIVVQRKESNILLAGKGRVPDVPLCAMCKVDGAFVLMPIDEITSLRPDLTKVAEVEAARIEAAKAQSGDGEYKPKAGKAGKGAKAQAEASGESKAGLTTVTVRNLRPKAHTCLDCRLKVHLAQLSHQARVQGFHCLSDKSKVPASSPMRRPSVPQHRDAIPS